MVQKTKKNYKYPKIPPCEQYEQYDGEHMKYKRNDKTFCRRKSRQKKEKNYDKNENNEINEINYSPESIDLSLDILDIKDIKDIKEKIKSNLRWVYLFGLMNRHEYNNLFEQSKKNLLNEQEKIKIESTLKSFFTQIKFFPKKLNYEQIKYITKSLKTSVRFTKKEKSENEDKKKKILIQRLMEVVNKYISDEFISIIEEIEPEFTIEKVRQYENLILNLIYNILIPTSYTLHTELDISEKMYKELIDRKKNMTIDPESNSIIITSLRKKLEHCILMNHFKNNCLSVAINIPYKNFNPVDICTSSVITNRGFVTDEIYVNPVVYSNLPKFTNNL